MNTYKGRTYFYGELDKQGKWVVERFNEVLEERSRNLNVKSNCETVSHDRLMLEVEYTAEAPYSIVYWAMVEAVKPYIVKVETTKVPTAEVKYSAPFRIGDHRVGTVYNTLAYESRAGNVLSYSHETASIDRNWGMYRLEMRVLKSQTDRIILALNESFETSRFDVSLWAK